MFTVNIVAKDEAALDAALAELQTDRDAQVKGSYTPYSSVTNYHLKYDEIVGVDP